LILPIDLSLLTVANCVGTDQNYPVAANKALVGSLRSTNIKLCDYNATNRDCVPTVKHTFTVGDTIDFTFGLTGAQRVRLFYAIIAVAS
jgi:hypothetical protein